MNVTDSMTASKSGKLLKHFSHIKIQFSSIYDY